MKSLFDLDIEVASDIADGDEIASWMWVKNQWLDPDNPDDAAEERHRLLALDLFIAIGCSHLKSQHFLPECKRIASRIIAELDLDRLDSTDALDRVLREAKDPAIYNCWPHHWKRDGRIEKELRLRELMLMAKGLKHMKWHFKRVADQIEAPPQFLNV